MKSRENVSESLSKFGTSDIGIVYDVNDELNEVDADNVSVYIAHRKKLWRKQRRLRLYDRKLRIPLDSIRTVLGALRTLIQDDVVDASHVVEEASEHTLARVIKKRIEKRYSKFLNGYFDLQSKQLMNPEQSTIDEVDINTSNSDGKGILDKECPTNGIDGSKGLQRIRKLYTLMKKDLRRNKTTITQIVPTAKQSCDENATDSEDDSANDILGMELTSYDTENNPLDFDDALHCPQLNRSPENVQSKSNEFLENLGPQLKNDLIYLKYPPGTGMIKSSRRKKVWQSINT